MTGTGARVRASDQTTDTRSGGDAGDLGRRIGDRRRQLGWTVAEVAARAGMAPDYLEFVEQDPTAEPSEGAMARLSVALDLPVATLLGGRRDRAAGQTEATGQPVLSVLDPVEARHLLAGGGVGRLAFRRGSQPCVRPVNFRVLDGDVCFRSSAHGEISEIAEAEVVAFECDHLDETMAEGWSVLASGTLRQVRDPAELIRVAALGIAPWAGGDRHTFFRLQVATVTGRRIDAGD